MSVRHQISRVLEGLKSVHEHVRQDAALRAGYLLEKTNITYSDEPKSREMFAHYLGDNYVELVLTEEEIDATTGALLVALDDTLSVASTAAFALRNSNRISAVPKLAEVLRRWVLTDGWAARQSIIAIEDILTLRPPGEYEWTRDTESAVREAQKALEYAAHNATEDGSDARRAAKEARRNIARHLRLIGREQ